MINVLVDYWRFESAEIKQNNCVIQAQFQGHKERDKGSSIWTIKVHYYNNSTIPNPHSLYFIIGFIILVKSKSLTSFSSSSCKALIFLSSSLYFSFKLFLLLDLNYILRELFIWVFFASSRRTISGIWEVTHLTSQ